VSVFDTQCPDGEANLWLEPSNVLAHNQEVRSKSTSGVEVSNVSPHGFWLLIGGDGLFVLFSEFPWFRDASNSQIGYVDLPPPEHRYWPDPDVDLAVASRRNPDHFSWGCHSH